VPSSKNGERPAPADRHGALAGAFGASNVGLLVAAGTTSADTVALDGLEECRIRTGPVMASRLLLVAVPTCSVANNRLNVASSSA
jgi:hypothetical protein